MIICNSPAYKGVRVIPDDFSKGKRGAVVSPDPKKVRITIRLDADILDHFKQLMHKAGDDKYHSLINDALPTQVDKFI